MAIYIYGLRCPLARAIRYIGKATEPEKRLVAHLGTARKGRTHCSRWLGKLERGGLKPGLIILRTIADDEDWAEAEREEIAKGFAAGWPLTNLTKGGEGASLTEEGRKRKIERLSDPETRRRMSEAAKARWSDPVLGAKGRAGNSAAERRVRVAEGARRRATPEYRAAQAARSQAAWSDAEKRQRIIGGITDETRKRVSEASRAAWETSPNMARCLNNLNSEESKRKINAKRAASGKKLAAHWADPEYRARVSAAIRQSLAERKPRKDAKA
jgi:hypothetical protein